MRAVLIVFVLAFLGCAFVMGMISGLPPAASAASQTTLPPANPERAAKCRKALKVANISSKISDSHDGSGTVVVSRGFYTATFEDKEQFDANVRCILSEGREQAAGLTSVTYRDAYTNKEIAKWSDANGFSVN